MRGFDFGFVILTVFGLIPVAVGCTCKTLNRWRDEAEARAAAERARLPRRAAPEPTFSWLLDAEELPAKAAKPAPAARPLLADEDEEPEPLTP
jgi:hypothetical protein